MDGLLQKIIMYLLAVLLLFIYPVYTAFERKDDISHMIVSKATHMLVDNVRNKGYISLNMYNEYNDIINITGNFYDVKMEVKSKRYDPIVNIYECRKNPQGYNQLYIIDEIPEEKYVEKYRGVYEGSKKYIDLHNRAYRANLDSITKSGSNTAPIEGVDYVSSAVKTTKIQYEIYTEKQILPAMVSQKIEEEKENETSQEKTARLEANNKKFLINKGDNFSVKVKNDNVTASSVFYSLFTVRNADYLNPRIYIHYGGIVRNEMTTQIIPEVK